MFITLERGLTNRGFVSFLPCSPNHVIYKPVAPQLLLTTLISSRVLRVLSCKSSNTLHRAARASRLSLMSFTAIQSFLVQGDQSFGPVIIQAYAFEASGDSRFLNAYNVVPPAPSNEMEIHPSAHHHTLPHLYTATPPRSSTPSTALAPYPRTNISESTFASPYANLYGIRPC